MWTSDVLSGIVRRVLVVAVRFVGQLQRGAGAVCRVPVEVRVSAVGIGPQRLAEQEAVHRRPIAEFRMAIEPRSRVMKLERRRKLAVAAQPRQRQPEHMGPVVAPCRTAHAAEVEVVEVHLPVQLRVGQRPQPVPHLDAGHAVGELEWPGVQRGEEQRVRHALQERGLGRPRAPHEVERAQAEFEVGGRLDAPLVPDELGVREIRPRAEIGQEDARRVGAEHAEEAGQDPRAIVAQPDHVEPGGVGRQEQLGMPGDAPLQMLPAHRDHDVG